MTHLTAPLYGDELLEAVSEAMASLHEHYHHRRPATVRTEIVDDEMPACVMGGIYTDGEKTMIEIQRKTVVQQTRLAFQIATQDKFIAAVQRLSGRRVTAFISNRHVGPDLEVDLFVLAPPGA